MFSWLRSIVFVCSFVRHPHNPVLSQGNGDVDSCKSAPLHPRGGEMLRLPPQEDNPSELHPNEGVRDTAGLDQTSDHS